MFSHRLHPCGEGPALILLVGTRNYTRITLRELVALVGRAPVQTGHSRRPKWPLCRFRLRVVGRSGDAQEDQNGTIQPHHILVSKVADTSADPSLRNGRDLIHHQSADSAQAVALAWLDRQPKQRSIGWVGSECAHRGRIRHVETVVLKNHNGTGLPRMVFTARNSPNLAALHIAPQSETALIKS